MELVQEDIVKLLLAIAVGGLIGAEREFRDKSAGFRTLIFICLGSTLFTIFSDKFAHDGDPARIAAQIVTGVGFLGAGVILRDRGRIVGLTTAAMIWLAAAFGMGIGSGNYAVTLAGTAFTVVVLWTFPTLEGWINHIRTNEYYEIVCQYTPGRYDELLALTKEFQLYVLATKYNRINQDLDVHLVLRGRPVQQAAFMGRLVADPTIKEVRH
jgi:putative Mg2+ transporter-C (MgtC) family protein